MRGEHLHLLQTATATHIFELEHFCYCVFVLVLFIRLFKLQTETETSLLSQSSNAPKVSEWKAFNYGEAYDDWPPRLCLDLKTQ